MTGEVEVCSNVIFKVSPFLYQSLYHGEADMFDHPALDITKG